MEEAGCCGCYSKNMLIRRCGVPPMMAVFGRVLCWDVSRPSAESPAPGLQASSPDKALQRTVRAAALKSVAEFDAEAAIRASLYKQS